MSISNFISSQDIKNFINDEDDLFDYRDNLNLFEFLFGNASDDSYGEKLFNDINSYLDKNKDAHKDISKFCFNTGLMYLNYSLKVDDIRYDLQDDLSKQKNLKLFREYAKGKDPYLFMSETPMELFNEFKHELVKSYPNTVNRIDQANKERDHLEKITMLWMEKSLTINNIFGHDIDTIKTVICLDVNFLNNKKIKLNELDKCFYDIKNTHGVLFLVLEILKIIQLNKESILLQEKSSSLGADEFDSIKFLSNNLSELIVEYFSMCEKYYGRSDKYLDEIFKN